jgi:hypothetical protein
MSRRLPKDVRSSRTVAILWSFTVNKHHQNAASRLLHLRRNAAVRRRSAGPFRLSKTGVTKRIVSS